MRSQWTLNQSPGLSPCCPSPWNPKTWDTPGERWLTFEMQLKGKKAQRHKGCLWNHASPGRWGPQRMLGVRIFFSFHWILFRRNRTATSTSEGGFQGRVFILELSAICWVGLPMMQVVDLLAWRIRTTCKYIYIYIYTCIYIYTYLWSGGKLGLILMDSSEGFLAVL